MNGLISPTIVVTDSGLGGLTVLAQLENKLSSTGSFKEPKLVYFNAVYEHEIGYNQLKSQEEKLHVFNSALEAMRTKFNPDTILIACNTLSVIYNETKFAKNNPPKVSGIVNQGVNQSYNRLFLDDESAVIIMGTPTTINSHAHKNMLVKKGIAEHRIIEQPCYYLESEIQINSECEKVHSIISDFIDEAAKNISSHIKKLFILLACTHYEYALPAFNKVLNKKFETFEILNPNEAMAQNIIVNQSKKKFVTNSEVEVHSRVDITEDELKTLGTYIKSKSTKTYDAIKNYTWDRNLFNI